MPIPAQTIQQQPAPSPPTIQVYSRETLVDVTVTDAKGQPIHGLKQSDFTITEDGKPQSIRSFHELSKDTPSATPAPLKLPPNVYTNLELNTGPLNVLFFDNINGGDGPRARQEAAKFIKSMAPGTRVALLGLGDRLTVLQGPTSDPALLLKVVNNPIRPLIVQAIGCTRQVVLDWATLDQLHELASYLSGIKGKKNVIWIGYGIPDMIFAPPMSCQDWRLPLQQAYDLLGDAQVTMYPLDPNGVGPMGGKHLAMEAVAESTGGVAYYENNDLASLMTKAVDTGSSYYSVSYVPPSLAYDGKFHAIGIKVNRPNVNLVYRKGYSAEDPTKLAHPPETLFGFKTRDTQPTGPAPDPLGVALSPIAPPATQLLFDVRVEPTTQPPAPTDPPVIGQLDPKLKKSPLSRYSILYMLPQSQIAFAAAGSGTYSGSLEFDIAAYDPDGKLVTIRSQTMKLPLTNEEYQQFIKAPFQFLQQLDLPPGQLTLRVGILDGVSNKLGTLQVPLAVAKTPASAHAGAVEIQPSTTQRSDESVQPNTDNSPSPGTDSTPAGQVSPQAAQSQPAPLRPSAEAGLTPQASLPPPPAQPRTGAEPEISLLAGTPPLRAPEEKPVEETSVPTLHVYTNLVQTAVVVLTPDRKPMGLIPEEKFYVSLDGRPKIRVTHVRLEGDEPISLAVLLDLDQPFPDLLKHIDDAIAGLASLSSNPQNKIAIYSLDCQLVRPTGSIGADPSELKRAVAVARQGWNARGEKRLTHCPEPSHLFDALMEITEMLHGQPGHRVILALTDGIDRGSRTDWNALRLSAQASGVAIFGLTDFLSEKTSTFIKVCDTTGGMITMAHAYDLAKSLASFTTLLRGRYIVEFPPAASAAAYHGFDITIEKRFAFIRSSGTLVSDAHPDTVSYDPATLPSKPAHGPR